MISWLPFAISSTFLVGTYNLLLEGSGKKIGNDITTKSAYIMLIMIIVGIVGTIVFIALQAKNPKSTSKALKLLKISPWRVVLPAIICIAYMLTNINALSKGGGIVMAIINLNVFVTLLGGALLYGDQINTKIILSLIAGMGFITYASYESSLIQKK